MYGHSCVLPCHCCFFDVVSDHVVTGAAQITVTMDRGTMQRDGLDEANGQL